MGACLLCSTSFGLCWFMPMPRHNEQDRKVILSIAYLGPALAGKYTVLGCGWSQRFKRLTYHKAVRMVVRTCSSQRPPSESSSRSSRTSSSVGAVGSPRARVMCASSLDRT